MMRRNVLATGSAALLFGATSAMGAVGLVDDFNVDDGLAGWAFAKVLDASGAATTTLSFSESGGALSVSNSAASIEQALLLNNSTGLLAGEELQVDVSLTSAIERDFGLAIGATHADLGNGTSGDNRNTADYIFIAVKNTNTDMTIRGFIGGSEIELIDSNDFASMSGADVTKLFIARTLDDRIELGWYDSSNVRHVAEDNDGGNPAGPLSYTPASLSIFDHVGFYADVRTSGGGLAGLDNLQIVPEPASVALMGLGGLLMLARRRHG